MYLSTYKQTSDPTCFVCTLGSREGREGMNARSLREVANCNMFTLQLVKLFLAHPDVLIFNFFHKNSSFSFHGNGYIMVAMCRRDGGGGVED